MKLPSGRYMIFAGRGFEYSLACAEVHVGAGETVNQSLRIRREVPSEGYVACDTHVHTLTHSQHGDATLDERMITLAGEGIELPIATDHNKHIDYKSAAARNGVTRYFTPVAAQTAHLVTLSGTSPLSEPLQKAVLAGTSATKFGFHAYREAWRASEMERAKR